MVSPNSDHVCLYCGEPTTRGRKGEHIIPDAIGGALTLNDVSNRAVCPKCNNGVLSQLDRELCSRSFLSAVASQQINARLWQVWDVDHESNNLLVEARPSWADDEMLTSLVCYPQITFERTGADLRGDYQECQRFGHEDFEKVLLQAARNCFRRYRSGEKRAINLERVRSGVIRDGYRLVPRIYTPHPIFEIERNIRKQSFVLRFADDEDKQFALNSLEKLGQGRAPRKWSWKPGSHYPTICFFFDIGETMRALMKLGLNLVAAYCSNTPVNHKTFSLATSMIRGDAGPIPPRVLELNGFIHAEDIQFINAPGNAHSFRLIHLDGKWHIFSSFFGGRIGSYVRVPGPNYETWRCADIVAPIGSRDWTVDRTSILPHVRKVRVEWSDGRAVTPSFKLQDSVSTVIAERHTRRPVRR